MRAPCLPPRSSISASFRCATPKTIWPAPGCRCGSIPDDVGMKLRAPPAQTRFWACPAPEQLAVLALRLKDGTEQEWPEIDRHTGFACQRDDAHGRRVGIKSTRNR